MLLSAASAVTVSDGGTVALDNGYLCDGRLESVNSVVVTAGSRGSWDDHAILSAADVCGVTQGAFADAGQRVPLGIGNLQAAPSPEELTQDDLAPTPPDRGMVDIAMVARQQVFAEIGSESQKPDLLDLSPGLELAADHLSTVASTAAVGLSHRGPNSLVGTRGRLAAFDLAMQQETPDWQANLEGPGLEGPADNLLVPVDGLRSTRSAPVVTPAAFSSLRRDSAIVPSSASDAVFRLLSSDESSELSPGYRATLARSEGTHPLERALAEHATGTQVEPDGEDAMGVHAVYLDQRREKPVAHLAIAVGLGQAVMGNPRQSADESEQEQLPPRRRSSL